MQINKRSRAELKQYFVRNAIPTESNFAELVDAMLNQREDGFARPPNDALSIEAAGNDASQKRAIHFYNTFSDANPAWAISLKPRQDPANAATAKAGFSIGDGATGISRLFIEQSTGNVGLGTTSPRACLDVPTGDVYVGKCLSISSPSDGTDAGVLDIRNETNNKYWHITHRSGEADKLIFWRNDASSSPWLATLKLRMDGVVEAPGGALLQMIGVGTQTYGQTQYPYETIQMDPGCNLRIWFGTKERFVLHNNGTLVIRFDQGFWRFDASGNIAKYNSAGALLWHLGNIGAKMDW